ncbi:MAG: restriction endonuclease subunit S [Thermoplasmataceae archaeon]
MTEIGEIPEEWEIKNLKEIADVKYGQRNPQTKGSIPLVGSNGVFDYVLDPLAEFPTIVIGRKGTAGGLTYLDGPSWPSDTTFYLQYKAPINQKYLFEYMTLHKLSGNKAKTTLPSLQRTELEAYCFPFPPLPEQQKIAEILTTADRKIELIDEEILDAERVKKGLMQTLLTKGIGHTKFKMTEIGEIPEEWQLKILSELVYKLIGGGTPSTFEADYWDGDIPWIRGAALTKHYLIRGERYITRLGLEESATKIIPRGNILLATRVSVGNVSINTVDMAISQDVTGLILRSNLISSDFLYWNLKNLYSQFQRMVQGSTIKGILKTDLSRIHFAIPSINEQQKIAEILTTADRKIELLKEKKQKAESLKKGLMQVLLTGQVRVKVDASVGDN